MGLLEPVCRGTAFINYLPQILKQPIKHNFPPRNDPQQENFFLLRTIAWKKILFNWLICVCMMRWLYLHILTCWIPKSTLIDIKCVFHFGSNAPNKVIKKGVSSAFDNNLWQVYKDQYSQSLKKNKKKGLPSLNPLLKVLTYLGKETPVLALTKASHEKESIALKILILNLSPPEKCSHLNRRRSSPIL